MNLTNYFHLIIYTRLNDIWNGSSRSIFMILISFKSSQCDEYDSSDNFQVENFRRNLEFDNSDKFFRNVIDKHANSNGSLIFHFSFTMFIYQDRPFWLISIKINFYLVILSMFSLFNGPISGRSRDLIQGSVERDDRGREQQIKGTFLRFNIVI